MRLTEKHIECAHVCARLEISGQNTKKKWRWNVVERIPIFTNWLKDEAFLAEKARCKAVFRVACPIFRSRHRRDRIEVSAGIANDEDEKSDTRLRALRQIADETAADHHE